MHIASASERTPECIAALLDIWESSVRQTHDFLSEKDIHNLKPLVEDALRAIPTLCIVTSTRNTLLGFMGVEGNKIEMLFISPDARGQGIGKKLVTYAVRELDVNTVDVNEQNNQAVGFYVHMGFMNAGRSDIDGQGKPFPILHMQL